MASTSRSSASKPSKASEQGIDAGGGGTSQDRDELARSAGLSGCYPGLTDETAVEVLLLFGEALASSPTVLHGAAV